MKKAVKILILSMMMVILGAAGASAQTYNLKNLTFDLPSNWSLEHSNDGYMIFQSNSSEYETIEVSYFDIEDVYSVEDFGDAGMIDINEDYYSDEQLRQNYCEWNPTARNLKVYNESVITSREYHNNTEFFRYQKAYTVRATGYNDLKAYLTCYTAVYNQRVYRFAYDRSVDSNKFNEFETMLNNADLHKIKIQLNGNAVVSDADPISVGGRTMVPIRAVAEGIGYTVGWNSENQAVVMSDGVNNIVFFINEFTAFKNDEYIDLDVAPFILNGRTYLPVRAVSEAMNASVNWDGNTQTVIINK